MNQLGRVRRLYYRDGLSLSEIERRTGLTRKTVRGWLKAAEGTVPKYRRPPADDTKIAPFAVELVLESGNPSAEHVENVLNRLKAAPPPESVETHLEIAEAPMADTGRYDRLREEVSHA